MTGKLLATLTCALMLSLTACEKKGPLEKAGEKVDHTIDRIKNGGDEPAADKVQDAMDKARDDAADIADKAKGK